MQKTNTSRAIKQKISGSPTRRILRKRKRRDDAADIHPVLHLQQTIGNQAVGRLIQAKLKVSQPGDKDEQEADRVADRVMRMPESQVQRQPKKEEDEKLRRQPKEDEEEKLSRQPQEDEKEEVQRISLKKDEEKDALQAKAVGGNVPQVSPRVQSQIHHLSGGGKPLPSATRAFFEPRFRHDFSEVRIHSGRDAAETAAAVNAKAFTIGKDIVFGAKQYAPEKTEGKKLLAHELTHVVQQSSSHQRLNLQRKPKPAKSKPPSQPAQTVYKEIKHQTYAIAGKNLREVAENIMARGEAGRDDWHVNWFGDTDADGKIIRVTVTVENTITMPVWPAYKKQPRAAKNEWDRFYKALEKHEYGHVDIVQKETRDFAQQLLGLTEEEANQAMDRKIEELRTANDQYDLDTQHGQTQGTIINTD
ncbi:MAG: DUF4157 domain-containing protein [Bdellovibrio sp.]|nr:DUF4157 domain-containing protein [Bdellovibrio sp.]